MQCNGKTRNSSADEIANANLLRRISYTIIIIIIVHEFHRDESLETKLQGRYVTRITLHTVHVLRYTKKREKQTVKQSLNSPQCRIVRPESARPFMG